MLLDRAFPGRTGWRSQYNWAPGWADRLFLSWRHKRDRTINVSSVLSNR